MHRLHLPPRGSVPGMPQEERLQPHLRYEVLQFLTIAPEAIIMTPASLMANQSVPRLRHPRKLHRIRGTCLCRPLSAQALPATPPACGQGSWPIVTNVLRFDLHLIPKRQGSKKRTALGCIPQGSHSWVPAECWALQERPLVGLMPPRALGNKCQLLDGDR